jgi:hypothetical protein
MPTTREGILAALHERLSALPANTLCGDVRPKRVPAAGLLHSNSPQPLAHPKR